MPLHNIQVRTNFGLVWFLIKICFANFNNRKNATKNQMQENKYLVNNN